MPLKKQVHPGWEYSGLEDPTRESTDKIKVSEVLKLLQEMFNNTNNWPTPEQVRAYHLKVERDSVRQLSVNSQFLLEYTFSVYTKMQALDSVASTIPSFNGDNPIPTIPISAQVPSVELADDSSIGPSVGSSKTRAGKLKAMATPPPLKKAKKVMGKKLGRININDPAPKPSSTLTPPKGPLGKFTICRSKR
jgi:hypothetical protein